MKVCVANRPFQRNGVEYVFTEGGILIQLYEAVHKADEYRLSEIKDEPSKETPNFFLWERPDMRREFRFDEWKNTREFDAHACYQIIQVVSPSTEATGVFQQRPFNLYAFSQPFRVTGYEFTAFFGDQHPLASVLVPFKDSPVSDWTIGFNVLADELLLSPEGVLPEKYTGLDVMRIEKLPKLRFVEQEVSVANGDHIDLEVQLCDFYGTDIAHGNVELFIETTGGILSNTRVKTDASGRAKVRFFAQYVIPGDTIKVKAGYKYFAGIDDCAVKVS